MSDSNLFGAPRPAAYDPAPRRDRRWILGGAAFLLGGGLIGGFGAGWALHSSNGPPQPPDTVVTVVAAPSISAGAATLPDVRGLALADSQQAIADAGIPIDAIEVTEVPSALTQGTVVKQDPIGGSTQVSAVTLFISVPGVVPEIAGESIETVRQALFDLGVRVVERTVYQPETPEGTVISVEPAAGAALTDEVTVTVAGPASSVYLSTLEAIESRCDSGEASANGVEYPNSVVCFADDEERVDVYLIDRLTTSFEGTVGVVDESDPTYAALVNIVADGTTVFSATVRYGQTTPFAVDTTGVLRLEVRYSSPTAEAEGQFVLGDALLVGGPEQMNQLADQ